MKYIIDFNGLINLNFCILYYFFLINNKKFELFYIKNNFINIKYKKINLITILYIFFCN